MRRFAVAALAVLPGLWACDRQIAAPSAGATRIFRVAEADGQLLPAHHPCPAPEEGVVAGADFVEGELVLYPQRTFTWRYTIRQYAAAEGTQEDWLEPVLVQGTYTIHDDSLALSAPAAPPRAGRIDGDVVELSETVPCRFAVAGDTPHRAALHLTEVEPPR